MNPGLTLLLALSGYLVGAVSFARLVLQRVKPDEEVQKIRFNVGAGEDVVESDAVSSTTVRLQAGSKYGCLTALFDIAKVFLPALLLRWWYPDAYYYLVWGAAGTIGHIWPVYYGFKGGRGQSPSLGVFFVIDWVGLVFSLVSGLLLGGFVITNLMIAKNLYELIFLVWVWVRWRDPVLVLFVLGLALLLKFASRHELQQTYALWRAGKLPSTRESVRLMGLARGMGRWTERLGISPAQDKSPEK